MGGKEPGPTPTQQAMRCTVLVESVWVKKYTKINIEKMKSGISRGLVESVWVSWNLSSIFCSKIANNFANFPTFSQFFAKFAKI